MMEVCIYVDRQLDNLEWKIIGLQWGEVGLREGFIGHRGGNQRGFLFWDMVWIFHWKKRRYRAKKRCGNLKASCLKDFVPKFLTEKETKSASFEEFLWSVYLHLEGIQYPCRELTIVFYNHFFPLIYIIQNFAGLCWIHFVEDMGSYWNSFTVFSWTFLLGHFTRDSYKCCWS